MKLINNPDNAKKIVFEIYRRMYRETKPLADFDELFRNKKTAAKPNWFMKYYLPMERQCEIIDEVVKEFNIPKRDARKLDTEIHLGSSPNSSEESWKEEIK